MAWLVIIKANQKVEIDWEVVPSPAGGPLVVSGCLRPPLTDVPITVEVTDPDGNARLLHTETDGQGCFRTDRVRRRAPYVPPGDGDYQIQVFVTAGGRGRRDRVRAEILPRSPLIYLGPLVPTRGMTRGLITSSSSMGGRCGGRTGRVLPLDATLNIAMSRPVGTGRKLHVAGDRPHRDA